MNVEVRKIHLTNLQTLALLLLLKWFFQSIYYSSPLIWNEEKTIMLLREVLVIQPHKFKEKTPKRGQKWAEIADNLNKAEQFNNKLTMRSVREKTNTLSKIFVLLKELN